MRVLVVGGAGYIGSHTARALSERGHQVILFDNLEYGHRAVADRLKLPLVVGNLLDICSVLDVLRQHSIEIVMHFAAYALVGQSVRDPALYYRNNFIGSWNLIECMRQLGINRLVFSSTCATYGNPVSETIDENHPQQPINAYGWSKFMVERLLKDYATAYDFRSVSLRYFNAAGCALDGLLGEEHEPETHLIPLCFRAALGLAPPLTILGTDYPTPDGTCIRDYIHVEDLASAHIVALEHLERGGQSDFLNIGTGQGYSVREVVASVGAALGIPVPHSDGPRRPGDPARLVAAAGRLQSLGWQPRFTTIDAIVGTAVPWFKSGGRYR